MRSAAWSPPRGRLGWWPPDHALGSAIGQEGEFAEAPLGIGTAGLGEVVGLGDVDAVSVQDAVDADALSVRPAGSQPTVDGS